MPLKEIHYQRFIEVLNIEYSKLWTIEKLLERINFLLPSNIIMNEGQLVKLIIKQHHFRVFKCRAQQQKESKTYYIFRRGLPRE